MNANALTCFPNRLALPNNGNATVRVEQKVNGVYQYLTTQQTQTTSGIFDLVFTPNQENIRISVSGSSGFALNNLSLDRDNVDTLVNRYLVSRGYRYSFQGQERDDEITKGQVNFQYRGYDPRIGRLNWATDPMQKSFPWNSPYAFSENVVINAVELEGLEKAYVYNVTGYGKNKNVKKSYDYDNYNKFNQRVYRYFNSQGEMYQEMVQKLNDKGEVLSYQTEKYTVDGDVDTKPYSLSNQTRGKKTNWYDGTIFSPNWGEGGHDGANLGGWGGSKSREIKGGTGAISVILAPFTIAGGGVYVIVGSVGLVNGADDMIGAIKNADNESLTQSLISDPNYKNTVGNIKTGATFFTAIGGGVQMWKKGVDTPSLIGTANDVQSLMRDINDKVNQNKKSEEEQ